MLQIEILDKKKKFEDDFNTIFTLNLRLPGGKVITRDYLDRPDGVAIVALDEYRNIYLTKQWRFAYNKIILQIPAGHVESDACEERLVEQVHNELREELGLDALHVEKLFQSILLANVKCKVHIYLATDLFPSRKEPDEDELIEVVKMPFDEAYKLFILDNHETTSYTPLSILLARRKLNL
jgi:ADP-ribose pyrophosphatase